MKNGQVFLKFFIRGIIGGCAIFLINKYCSYMDIPVMVGLNLCNFFITGTLGIPGVALLYSILFYQIL